MSDEPRTGKPYLWATHVTGLAAGEKSCQWAPWYKAHYFAEKRPDENEGTLLRWQAEHAAMVRAEAAAMRAAGWTVTVEDQNKFTYRGRTANVGGKPDIVATREVPVLVGDVPPIRQAVIKDCKSGKERDADAVQVALYMALAPSDLPALADREVSGAVVYRHRERPVTAADAAGLKPLIVEQVLIAAGDIAPPRTPSAAECRYCDIAACPDRAVADGLRLDEMPLDGALF